MEWNIKDIIPITPRKWYPIQIIHTHKRPEKNPKGAQNNDQTNQRSERKIV